MALTTQQQTAIRAIIAAGSLDATLNDIRALAITDKKQAAGSALQSAVSVTISDWSAVDLVISQASATTLLAILSDLAAATSARDQTKLGPLFVQLYGAIKAHFA